MSQLSAYRRLYPEVLNYTSADAVKAVQSLRITPEIREQARERGISSKEFLDMIKTEMTLMAKDAELSRKIGVVRWHMDGFEMVRQKTILWRHQTIAEFSTGFLHMPPVIQLLSSYPKPLSNPFDMLDDGKGEFSLFLRTMGGQLVDETHDRIVRGHAWLGIGQWNVSIYRYLEGLGMALATNNDAAAESLVRFLVDAYVASGEFSSAKDLLMDYLPYVDRVLTPLYMTREAIEDASFGLVMAGEEEEASMLLRKVDELDDLRLDRNVRTWNIVTLLLDVWGFLGRRDQISLVESAIVRMRAIVQSL